jgi:hypothetical protein
MGGRVAMSPELSPVVHLLFHFFDIQAIYHSPQELGQLCPLCHDSLLCIIKRAGRCSENEKLSLLIPLCIDEKYEVTSNSPGIYMAFTKST